VRRAEAYRTRVIADQFARAAQFTNQFLAYQQSPRVFSERAYLTSLALGASQARKIVLTSTNAQETLLLNLEDKLRPDLLDAVVEPRR